MHKPSVSPFEVFVGQLAGYPQSADCSKNPGIKIEESIEKFTHHFTESNAPVGHFLAAFMTVARLMRQGIVAIQTIVMVMRWRFFHLFL